MLYDQLSKQNSLLRSPVVRGSVVRAIREDNYTLPSVWGCGSHWTNKTVKWCPPDYQELYLQNLANKQSKALLNQNGWIDAPITYKFNEYGFRSDSFDKECNILFNGCSQSFGTGLLLEQSWPYIVSKHYGVAYHNLAVCGSDWSNVAQRTLYWLPKLKPNIMVIKEPTLIRFNWFGIDEQRFISNSAERKYTGISLGADRDENPIRSTSMHTDKEILQCSTTTRYGKIVNPLIELLSIESNVLWARHAMLLLIVALCKHYACDLVTIPSHKLSNTLLDRKDTDVARDLEHYGVKENLFVSELCINKIDNKSFETIDV